FEARRYYNEARHSSKLMYKLQFPCRAQSQSHIMISWCAPAENRSIQRGTRLTRLFSEVSSTGNGQNFSATQRPKTVPMSPIWILAGAVDHKTTQRMWRLAARCAEQELAPEAVAPEGRNFLDRQGSKRAQLGDWLERLGRHAKWFNEMLPLESADRKRCETLL